MKTYEKRAQGVTPGLSRDYPQRDAEHQAAFVLPYLKKGMQILDLGCGPGTITIGLAKSVKPGQVIGYDHDKTHLKMGQDLARQQHVPNIKFVKGDALQLPFKDSTFDLVYENNVFTHLSVNALKAARELHRVLKPGGIIAARDVDADAIIWGNLTEALKQYNKFFYAWQQSRGSDIQIGRKLPVILREAGFLNMVKSVSADTKGNPDKVRSHGKIMLDMLDGPLGEIIISQGWGDVSMINYMREGIREWAENPDSFFAMVHVEVLGHKN